jgi:hypothetical protein
MPLTLNIPAIQEDAILLAETRPAKIALSLTEWRSKSLEDFAADLHDELQLLNRQNVSSNNRLQALEAYLPYIASTAESLAEHHIKSLLPLDEKAKASAIRAESLWLELGYGYKLVLTELQNQLIKIGTDKSSALAIYRAIYAISGYKSVYHQTYVNPPSHVWSDLHQLYFCAVKLGLHKIEIESKPMHPDALALPTIEDAYKHALLTSLAEPEQLTQNDMLLIDNYLTHHIKRTAITAAIATESTSGLFIIKLDSDKPPSVYSKQKEAINPLSDALLQTLDMVVAMHEDLKALQNHQLPKSGSIPKNSKRNDYIELLTHLIKNWGVNPKRIFNRTQKNGDIALISGIKPLHSALNGNKVLPSRWDILNISPTGIAIRRHHTAEKNISVGALVGIKARNEEYLSIGIVRRANCGNRDRLDIGVQLIAPQAMSAIAHVDDRNYDELILMLAEISAVNQAATIIAPRGMYAPARTITIHSAGTSKKAMLTKLVECTHLIERIQYSLIT